MRATAPIFARMALFKRSGYWQHVNPTGAVADFITVFRGTGRHRWRFVALSAACTFAVFSVMWQEEAVGPPARPHITYITSFAPGRSDAEIAAANRENQLLQDRLAADQAKRDEEVRRIYKTLGRMSGMDVDALERKALAEQAAKKRAEEEHLAAQLAEQRLAAEQAEAQPPPDATPE